MNGVLKREKHPRLGAKFALINQYSPLLQEITMSLERDVELTHRWPFRHGRSIEVWCEFL